jgi:hypothetical protein
MGGVGILKRSWGGRGLEFCFCGLLVLQIQEKNGEGSWLLLITYNTETIKSLHLLNAFGTNLELKLG